jgi:hypothetical protein
MTAPIRCPSCGAMMKPAADARIHACEYCGAQTQVAIDGEQLAAGLRLDLQNIEEFMYRLAHSLHHGFTGRTKFESMGEKLELFELNLDIDMFVAKREPHGIIAQHKKMVRGIALKTATLPFDRWVELLTRALAVHANENARVAQVLAQLKAG